jgi:hypothetical protein
VAPQKADEGSSEAFTRSRLNRKVGAGAPALASQHPALGEKIQNEADYFDRNKHRMRYPKSRRQHLFVGSASLRLAARP